MAAMGRTDHLVHPFPRSLRVRPGTLELVGFPDAAEGAPTWLGKLILDIEEIKPGCLGKAVPISHIVILQDPANAEVEMADRRKQEMHILRDKLGRTTLFALLPDSRT